MATRTTYKTINSKAFDVVSPNPTGTAGDMLDDNTRSTADNIETLNTAISNATSSNTLNTIVKRDGSRNFAANVISCYTVGYDGGISGVALLSGSNGLSISGSDKGISLSDGSNILMSGGDISGVNDVNTSGLSSPGGSISVAASLTMNNHDISDLNNLYTGNVYTGNLFVNAYGTIGFFGATPIAQPTVNSGSDSAVLDQVVQILALYGLVIDDR